MPLVHNTTEGYWKLYSDLPSEVKAQADKQFAILRSNSRHPSLHFKQVGINGGQELWSARVTKNYRALAFKQTGGYLWWWIGLHNEYEYLIR